MKTIKHYYRLYKRYQFFQGFNYEKTENLL